MGKAVKIIMTILGLIALYLIIANGNEFNKILGTAGDLGIRGIGVLQGRVVSASGNVGGNSIAAIK